MNIIIQHIPELCAIFMIIKAISILQHTKDDIFRYRKDSEELIRLNRIQREIWSKSEHSEIYDTPHIVMKMAECDNFDREMRKYIENIPFRVAINNITWFLIHGLSAYILWYADLTF